MANRAGVATLALAVALTLSGCGTIGNLAGSEYVVLEPIRGISPEARVYGGVATDVFLFQEGVRSWSYLGPLLVTAGLFDLPLSAVADTLTLPLTVYVACNRLMADPRVPAPSAGGPASD